MIKLLRVDHRLLHGQVAFSWKNAVEADCILIACDAVMKDDLRKTSIKMAKPSGVKLVIKSMDDAVKAINSGVTHDPIFTMTPIQIVLQISMLWV